MPLTTFVRFTLVVGTVAVPLAWFSSDVATLAGFLLVTVWVNGPLSPLLPATFEPILMIVGRVYPTLLVAVIATAGTVYVEYFNYHLYGRLLTVRSIARRTESELFRRLRDLFRRAPFAAVWCCSIALPYWPVRILGPASAYPVKRQLLATALGRFPRWWFFAALGNRWRYDAWILMFIPVAVGLGLVSTWAIRSLQTRRSTS